MAWAWGDPITDGFDWSDIATLNKLDKSVWERCQAFLHSVGPWVRGAPALPVYDPWVAAQTNLAIIFGARPAMADGTDVQLYELIHTWQNLLAFLFGGPDGPVGPGFNLASYDPRTSSPIAIAAAEALPAPVWRRKCPRRVNHVADAADIYGNAAATGQKAQIDDLGGLVRIHNGSSWATVPPGAPGDVLPDTLDSTLAAPYATTPGYMLADDYMGLWVFQQVYDVARSLKKWMYYYSPSTHPADIPLCTSFSDTQAYLVDSSQGVSGGSWAAAKADVDANWPGANLGPSVDPRGDAIRYSRGHSTPPTPPGTPYDAEARSISVTFKTYTIDHRPKSVANYVPLFPFLDTGPLDVFDDQGTGGTQSQYFNVYSAGLNSLRTNTAPEWPANVLTQPLWCADLSGDPVNNEASRGFTTEFLMITTIEWDFEFP